MAKRSEVRIEDTWDLSHMFSSLQEQAQAQKEVQDDTAEFVSRYRNKIAPATSADIMVEYWRALEQLISKARQVASYIFLDYSVDMINQEKMRRNLETNNVISKLFSDISFYESELEKVHEDLI